MTAIDNVVLGDWDKETVRLDFDDMASIREVKLWAFRICSFYKLEGFIILESSRKTFVVKKKEKIIYSFSKRSYHVVFDRSVTWASNVKIMNWVALESGNRGLQEYVRMQCIKKTSTVRISNKGNKPFPKIVFRFGSQDRMIKKFLDNRAFVLFLIKENGKDVERD